ncbi:MAG: biotin/lipoyl-containing protein [Candidatus Euphemobacter frigidus]|nr:biotin/lipoyl-containing protein [Candidatus Euphemobacter frigidus]MDP8276026.1 biotin/lipoyl-containing protein [Candidatus Euphemobacter frigidus]
MKIFKIRVNGKSYQVEVEEEGTSPASPPKPVLPKSPPPVQGIPQPVAMPTSRPPFPSGSKAMVNSPLPGTILAIKVTEGDAVTRGQTLVVLEAMKMENEIPSPADGKVSSIKVKKGDSVSTGDLLLVLE